MAASTQVTQIYQGQDFYVPAFEIRVGNQKLKREVVRDILKVTYHDSLTEIDNFEITINNWDAAKYTYKYSDAPLFLPGQKVEVRLGYFPEDRMRLMLTGEITSLRPAFPSGGQPTLTISGLNLLHRLRRRQETHPYQNKTDNQIAREIAGRLRVDIDTDRNGDGENKRHPYFLQYNEYDILFLLKRARAIGYDLYVDEKVQGNQARPTLHFGPSQNVKKVTYELTYGKTLIEFTPTLTTANQVGSVTVRGWNATRKAPIEVTITRQNLQTHGVGRAGGQQQIEQAFNEREEIIVDHPVRDNDEARILARQTLEDIAKEMVKGTGSVVGLPDLRAGGVLHLCGMGTRFSGRYFVTSTTHSIDDSGYITRFECRREEVKEEQPCKQTTPPTA
jgi:phage protein D